MAVSIDYQTFVISVPQADLTPLGGNRYAFDVDTFRLELKSLEANETGMVFGDTHKHNTEVTLSGVTFARIVEILSPYTIEFEDVGSPYQVECIGANHNVADVKTVNQASLIIGNSAGLINIPDITSVRKTLENREEIDFTAQQLVLFDDDGVTPIRRWPLETDGGEPVTTARGVQTKRKPSSI